jgi:hypothetical protein
MVSMGLRIGMTVLALTLVGSGLAIWWASRP